MPSCISVFTNVDFTAVALSAPQDGFSIAVAMATPTPTPGPTSGPTATPSPSPSDTPIPTASPTETPSPSPSDTPIPTESPTATPAATPNPTASPTETPSPSPSETPLPTPSVTPASLCVSVDGSTNGFNTAQLASPDNGFSFANNDIVGGGLTPGPDCANAGVWPAYGSANKYNITIADNTTEMWFSVNLLQGDRLYANNNTSGTRLSLTVDDSGPGDPNCTAFLGPVFAFYTTLSTSGAGVAGQGKGIFMIKGSNGTFPYTVDVWIDF